MWEFLRSGGPVMFLLVVTSIVGLAFIIERALALRWTKVIPPYVSTAIENCRTPADLPKLVQVCNQNPSPLSRLTLTAQEHLRDPKEETIDLIETRARHEVVSLERGLFVLEVVVGIAPLLGLVGAIHGLITLFGNLGKTGVTDNTQLAAGIAIALNTTLVGLLVAIPALAAWSYFTRKVDTLAVEMEGLLDKFLRHQYRASAPAATAATTKH